MCYNDDMQSDLDDLNLTLLAVRRQQHFTQSGCEISWHLTCGRFPQMPLKGSTRLPPLREDGALSQHIDDPGMDETYQLSTPPFYDIRPRLGSKLEELCRQWAPLLAVFAPYNPQRTLIVDAISPLVEDTWYLQCRSPAVLVENNQPRPVMAALDLHVCPREKQMLFGDSQPENAMAAIIPWQGWHCRYGPAVLGDASAYHEALLQTLNSHIARVSPPPNGVPLMQAGRGLHH